MKPLTRKEMLLDGVAKGNLDTFKPATREEVFAKRALANTGGSGGSSEMLVAVEINNDTVTLDKTFAEINDHCMQGGAVRFETFVLNSLLKTSSYQLHVGVQVFFTFTRYTFTNDTHDKVEETTYVCNVYQDDTGLVIANRRTIGDTIA